MVRYVVVDMDAPERAAAQIAIFNRKDECGEHHGVAVPGCRISTVRRCRGTTPWPARLDCANERRGWLVGEGCALYRGRGPRGLGWASSPSGSPTPTIRSTPAGTRSNLFAVCGRAEWFREPGAPCRAAMRRPRHHQTFTGTIPSFSHPARGVAALEASTNETNG